MSSTSLFALLDFGRYSTRPVMASVHVPARSTDAGALDASQTVQFMLPTVKLARRLDHVKVPPRAYKT